MDLEASIVERLQELRQWQIEQQERLLKQQQMQRQLLTRKQDCIYKALELSIKELDFDESTLNTNNADVAEKNLNDVPLLDNKLEYSLEDVENKLGMDIQKLAIICNASCKDNNDTAESNTDQQNSIESQVDVPTLSNNNIAKKQTMDRFSCDIRNLRNLSVTPQKKEKQISEFLIEGVTPLPGEKESINHICIDDVPILSPKKDFQSLLEEKLKDCHEDQQDTHPITKPIVKRPFLRKGEGLSRFRLNRASESSMIRPRSKSLSAMTRSESKNNKSHNSKHKNNAQSVKNTRPIKSTSITNLAQQQLCLKNVPLPKKKVRSKSECSSSNAQPITPINQSKNVSELNTSDFQSRTQKEIEEVRMFELLEEKAENSSFCSTSSAVVAFLQQSTPFKVKKKGYSAETSIVNMKQKGSPTVKTTNGQSVVKKVSHYTIQNGMHQCTDPTYKQHNEPQWNSTSCIKRQESQLSVAMDNRIVCDSYINMKDLQEPNRSTKENMNIKKNMSLRNHVQHVQDQRDCYDFSNSINTNEVDVSLHVRFSEYNEYKTIGLTDTSSISNDSSLIKSFGDDKVWDDSYTPEASDTEVLPVKQGTSLLPKIVVSTNNHESKSVQCSVFEESDDLSYKTETPNAMCKANDFMCNKRPHQNIYDNHEESEFSDTIDQTSDEEQTILNQSDSHDTLSQINDNSLENDKLKNYIGEGKKINKCLNTYEEGDRSQNDGDQEHLRETDSTVFKSDLLKTRLLELEREIDIFRKENATLSLQRQKLQEDQRKLHRDFAEKEKAMEEYRKQAEDRLQEEKKKLSREKVALESRLRDSQEKAQQSKLERQEMQKLKQELEALKEEIAVKESRWNASQSRQKCQMRILKMENTKLKQEIERLQNVKGGTTKGKVKPGSTSNTKAIHQISKQLNLQTKKATKIADTSSSDSDHKLIDPMMEVLRLKHNEKNVTNKVLDDKENDHLYDNYRSDNQDVQQKYQQNIANITKKRNLYEHLLKEATSDLTGNHKMLNVSSNLNVSKPDLDDSQATKLDTRKSNLEHDCADANQNSSNGIPINYHSTDNNIQLHSTENSYPTTKSPTFRENYKAKLANSLNEELSTSTENTTSPSQYNCKIDKQDTKQIQHPDGRIEYWYSNGNVKKVFPDQGITKMIYYNGDVRETDKDGKTKYFYASTRTWHTTMPDGSEILEFPDGQVERRSKNGTVEISFPDGSIRILQSDGSEKWALTDGTIVQTFSNGEKILTLPNGQREIHTKTHKRREYPDGTVKLVYPDGTQETRYSNGRTRLKDKDGNLLMDSYQ